ncbi:leucine-rich repeat domain-containing protein [Neomegalonema sp.]|uniref:leucine-rich repeat domain-containing protein n=1 Tax=Neomegalonema sp. TaxID=2039713 RepID=UPI00260903D4|nr:leucine-rich repeat domain-containing protein [Neomegalonema sp.]MDD2868159.1 leucine-rich repeat domain-containing protein [Neomegalonema sp.]
MRKTTKRLAEILTATALVFGAGAATAQESRTAEQIQQDLWKTNEHAAFAEARRRIAEIEGDGRGQRLSFGDLEALKTLPPEITRLTGLQNLDLTFTSVSDPSPLPKMSGSVQPSQALALLWKTDEQATLVEARRRIAAIKGDGSGQKLSFADLEALKTLPPEISSLKGLKSLTYLFSPTHSSLLAKMGMLNIPKENFAISNLMPLAGLTGLQELNLASTEVRDLTPLAGLTELRTLDLSYTPISDLTPLAGLTKLQKLYLSSTSVGDLTPLAGLIGLQELGLRSTSVSDLAPLAGLTGLRTFYLSRGSSHDLMPLVPLIAQGLEIIAID